MDKLIYLTVSVWLKEPADINEVIQDMDYDFTHPDITNTEVRSWEEKTDI